MTGGDHGIRVSGDRHKLLYFCAAHTGQSAQKMNITEVCVLNAVIIGNSQGHFGMFV